MPGWLAGVRVDSGALLAVVAAIALVATILAIVGRPTPRRPTTSEPDRRARVSGDPDQSPQDHLGAEIDEETLGGPGSDAPGQHLGGPRHGRRLTVLGLTPVRALVVFAVASLLAATVFWIVIDVTDVFGIEVAETSRIAWSLGLGLAAVGVAALIQAKDAHPGTLRRVVGGVAAVSCVLATALVINDDAGAVHELGDLLPAGPVPTFTADPEPTVTANPISEADWTPPADMPDSGVMQQADIPSSTAGFAPRPATVYLPPAAQVENPPALPVMVLLSGQPGSTQDVLVAGQMKLALDEFASDHHGLAPIVVTPDQLGPSQANTMCADTASGSVRSYLEHDVPEWIEANLRVATDRTSWVFGGFSNGATCTYQVGLDQPDRYGTLLAIAAEVHPGSDMSEEARFATFGNDHAAYAAVEPLAVMARHAPYPDTLLIHGVGEKDGAYSGYADTLLAAAQQAGITTKRLVAPGSGHDFRTVAWVCQQALPLVAQRAGLITG